MWVSCRRCWDYTSIRLAAKHVSQCRCLRLAFCSSCFTCGPLKGTWDTCILRNHDEGVWRSTLCGAWFLAGWIACFRAVPWPARELSSTIYPVRAEHAESVTLATRLMHTSSAWRGHDCHSIVLGMVIRTNQSFHRMVGTSRYDGTAKRDCRTCLQECPSSWKSRCGRRTFDSPSNLQGRADAIRCRNLQEDVTATVMYWPSKTENPASRALHAETLYSLAQWIRKTPQETPKRSTPYTITNLNIKMGFAGDDDGKAPGYH